MPINKKIREQVRLKYDGRCFYTGKPLGEDWQVDHIHPRCKKIQSIHHIQTYNDFENLVPALKIVNHYKRALGLNEFRDYMKNFHIRLSKLPKTTNVPATKRRIKYMNDVANAFEISFDKPFSGLFYFEQISF